MLGEEVTGGDLKVSRVLECLDSKSRLLGSRFMRLYTNVLREMDYKALAPHLALREVNISNQQVDDKGQAEVIPKPNCANVK
ncbi:hypothetical protein WISP_106729 [Willisornis vidua]|uniref:Uncharacterized protein n=1 Tax=Willisornis vidua TaxID=1566151 RepID=A0ABQ9D1F0_9PASS|nr:hypothetical protein WISP_106729 [Willisornis vidua]